ncbi:helix-turn-helix domain-containing protein [Candidatus Woesearchaeota archaeon]|nr:helix-turn-helix domain-containing protein [Candidatus Woesearchaeota archaeon]
MKSIKETILKNPKTKLDYGDFSILIDRIRVKKTDELTRQSMYTLYGKLDEKRKLGINKSFLWLTLKEKYSQKKNLEKFLKIPPSTRRLWEKEGFPCLLFNRHHNFFEKFTKLKGELSNEEGIYELLKKHFEINNKEKIIEVLRNLSNNDLKRVRDFLILKEIKKGFKVKNRWIMYLCNRVESDPCKWREKPPKIMENLILVSKNKPLEQTYKTRYSYKLRIKKFNEHLERTSKIIKELERYLRMEEIKKIIDTYNRGNTKGYLELLKGYKKQWSTFDKGINRHEFYSWQKGSYPDGIRTLLNIHKYGLHKMDKKTLSRIIGWGFGDGGISNRLSYYFLCGNKKDLEKIKRYISKKIPKIKIRIEENKSTGEITKIKNKIPRKIIGNKSWILYIKNSTFVRFLYGKGLPKGEKVLQRITIPLWITKGDDEIKLEFLEGLLECENQKHSVKLNKLKNKIEIPVVSFGMCKDRGYQDNLIEFLNSIKGLLEGFNIRCGEVETPKPSNIRKRDGKITYFSRFPIYTSILDVINFSKIIKYKFNTEKKKSLEITVEEANLKLRRFNKQKIKFEKAKKLFKEGMNYSEISRELNVSQPTIRHWIVGKEHLPRPLDIDIGGILNE